MYKYTDNKTFSQFEMVIMQGTVTSERSEQEMSYWMLAEDARHCVKNLLFIFKLYFLHSVLFCCLLLTLLFLAIGGKGSL